ncbi:transketolase [Pseudoroseicyclus tamaricis]|uniref:Transketolase n=1 Tax=Pseudoroseicyclus tamaricis TaxID=2705421 RepID=A0A6B2JR55_9RHOB|nr:transketolase [Pseudoroseicyclus tamaricis]NDV00475.1 transketolase [Pseudoroseicyclus tamaricis]
MDIAALREAHPEHWMKAAAIRTLTLDAVAAANSGHSGMPMGMADIATVLFEKHLKFDPKNPLWPDRDRFIVSNGHGSMLLYSVLYLTGYEGMSLQDIKDFRQWESATPGHPEYNHSPGIETTTGPLGQGIANSVGFAIAEESLRARWGKKIMDHRTWVFAGDGCLMEGVSQEAIALAGHQKLGNLTVFFDHNSITIDGPTSLADSTDQCERFSASGWHVQKIDGHDPVAIDEAIEAAKADPRPSMIQCETHIALGSAAQDTAKGHGALTDDKVVADAKAAYGWDAPAFEIPADIKSQWESMGERGAAAHAEWNERIGALSDAKRAEFERSFDREAPKALSGRIKALKKQISEEGPKVATRKSSEMVLEVVNPVMKETLGGSADLTGSNNTKTGDLGIFSPEDRKGRYIHYGIREHGMAAAMNGLASHGGVKPYGGTFFCFTDYARPAIRLSALMGVPVIYVMTHDSIGLGEDGPTHQPVEHLAMVRATPGLLTFRPADTVETAEAWEIALSQTKKPSVLALTRQGLPTVRTKHTTKNLTAQGAYVLAEAENKRRVILMASGSEVEVAMEAKKALEAEGIGTRVVSVPSMELFREQDEAYRKRVLPAGPVRVAIEAGVRQPWDWLLLGERGREQKAAFVGMDSFGASAPAEVLFEKFGITAGHTVEKAKALLG